MKVLMFYELAEGGSPGAGALRQPPGAHARIPRPGRTADGGPLRPRRRWARWEVFTSRAAAEEFARDDPFMLNGVVGRCTIHDWNEDLA
jgi:hypothetical protein